MNDLKLSCFACKRIGTSHVSAAFTTDGGMNGYEMTWRCSECNIDVRIRADEEAECIEKVQAFFNDNGLKDGPAPPPENECKTCRLKNNGCGPFTCEYGESYEPWRCCETCSRYLCTTQPICPLESVQKKFCPECEQWTPMPKLETEKSAATPFGKEPTRGASLYSSLENVFSMALAQASTGKGKVRHAEDGEPFEKQQICEITRRLGHGFPLGQAVKKIQESPRLDGEHKINELLGAINYIAASIIVEIGEKK